MTSGRMGISFAGDKDRPGFGVEADGESAFAPDDPVAERGCGVSLEADIFENMGRCACEAIEVDNQMLVRCLWTWRRPQFAEQSSQGQERCTARQFCDHHEKVPYLLAMKL